MSLPLFQQSEKIVYSDSVVRRLISLESAGGQDGSRTVAGKFNRWLGKNGRGRKRIADNLFKIKHWKIILGDYSLASNIEATWFIDPPYNNSAGRCYKNNCDDINYKKLADWCKSRLGQVIVCEELLADWLPFEFLCGGRSGGGQNIEAVWEQG